MFKRQYMIAAAFAGALCLPVASQLAAEDVQLANLPGVTQAELKEMREEYRRPDTIPFPASNPYSPQKVALGKLLYYDTRLSGSNLLSCASCHNPGFGWSDGQPLAVGHAMQILGRRTPTILDAAWGELFFWDGRADSLEEQALGPIQAAGEMNQDLNELVRELEAIPGYRQRFEEAFPGVGITPETIGMAIATYERTVVSTRAPFDEWIEGDENAISDSAKRGFVIFNTKAKCAACHSGWAFTDASFHDIGLPSYDLGRGEHLPEIQVMQHAFKTPGLRDIERRAPYMHDGSLETLEEVVDHYISGGVQRPSLSPEMYALDLSSQERDDLVAFLRTMTGPLNPVVLPVLPR